MNDDFIKKILTKYGSDVNFQQYLNIGFTLFGIIFLMRTSHPARPGKILQPTADLFSSRRAQIC